MTNDAPPPLPPTSSRVRFDGTINAGHILTASVLVFAVVAAYTTTDARITSLERDTAAGSRITAAIRDQMDQTQIRLATLETDRDNMLDRMDRGYTERTNAQKALQDILAGQGLTLSGIQADVAGIAAAMSGNPGTHR